MTLVAARLQARAEARGAGRKEQSGDHPSKTGLDVAEQRRHRLERELAEASEASNAVVVARIERQIAELDRSERHLREALGLIEAVSGQGHAKPATPESPAEVRLGSQENAAAGGDAETGPGQDADLTDRMARLSAPPRSGEPKAEQ